MPDDSTFRSDDLAIYRRGLLSGSRFCAGKVPDTPQLHMVVYATTLGKIPGEVGRAASLVSDTIQGTFQAI